MSATDYIGQTLDKKYRIERELDKGGMGSVYLATHLGTERPVAVKGVQIKSDNKNMTGRIKNVLRERTDCDLDVAFSDTDSVAFFHHRRLAVS